jgi:hypothetical protein
VDDFRKDNSCFKCGKPGHYIANCPLWGNNSNNQANPAKPPQTGRVHHITAEEAQQDSNIVLGMCTINTHPALVLFDYGASHSFVSKNFVAKNHLPVSFLEHRLVIQTPASEMRTSYLCHDLTISINLVEFPAHLNMLSLPGLDAILGMDWLTRHAAHIACRTRAVTLTNPHGVQTIYFPKNPHPP